MEGVILDNKNKTFRSVLIALFCAIIIVQNFVPFFGYIPVGPLNLTTIHVTVIIAAIVLGPRDGAIVGGVWGLITFIRAYVWPTSPLATIVFVNPLVSVVPRILIGVVAGYAFIFLRNKIKKVPAMCVASILGAMTNTILVLGLIYLLYRGQSQALYSLDVKALLPYLLGVIGTNGVPEAILAGIVGPAISVPLLSRLEKK